MADDYEPYFRFFPNYLRAAKEISDPAIRCEIYEGLSEYVFSGGTWPEFKHEAAAAVCKSLKVSLDTSISISKKCSKAGQASGEARASNAAGQAGNMGEHGGTCGNMGKHGGTWGEHEGTEERSKKKEGVNKEKKTQVHMTPPTLEEVKKYFTEKGASSDPEIFFDYYEANGWVQGKGKPLKDWKAAARNWERKEEKRKEEKKSGADRLQGHEAGKSNGASKSKEETITRLRNWSDRPNPSQLQL